MPLSMDKFTAIQYVVIRLKLNNFFVHQVTLQYFHATICVLINRTVCQTFEGLGPVIPYWSKRMVQSGMTSNQGAQSDDPLLQVVNHFEYIFDSFFPASFNSAVGRSTTSMVHTRFGLMTVQSLSIPLFTYSY